MNYSDGCLNPSCVSIYAPVLLQCDNVKTFMLLYNFVMCWSNVAVSQHELLLGAGCAGI